jgi:FkbM family methyltransferase
VLHASLPGVEFVWSRRGLWREGKNEGAFEVAKGFDVVIEPGDLAAPIDMGASATRRAGVMPIRPVVLVQPEQYLSRDEARTALGIPKEGRAILLNLNDSSSETLATLIEHAKQVIQTAAGNETIHFFAPLHPLHRESHATTEGVVFAPVYPVARYFNAFDGAVSMAGYNSFHEIVLSGLPAVFVAHSNTNVDDQQRRARFAELSGRAFWAPSLHSDEFERAIERMLLPDEPIIAAATAKELGAMTGAAEFADFLAEAVRRTGASPSEAGKSNGGQESRRGVGPAIRSGGNLLATAATPSELLLLDAVEHETPELEALAAELATLQDDRPVLTPIFLIGRGSPRVLAERRFAFESVMTEAEWSLLEVDVDYPDYLRRRIEGMGSHYGTDQALTTKPGQDRAAWVAVRLPETPSAPHLDEVPEGSADREAGSHSFHLLLPSLGSAPNRSLHIDLPSHFHVPRLLEQQGLAGYEASALACWLAILSLPDPGAAFDVGANVGPYAWVAAALTERRVVAFEPVPELLDAVGVVAERNGLQIVSEGIALTDHDGSATLYLSDKTDSSNSLVAGFRRSSKSVEVVVKTLDSYVEETGHVPHALKIDTETNEPEVIGGGLATLSSHRPWLIVEVLAQRTEDRLMEAMQTLDYFWYPINDDLPLQQATEIVGDPNFEHMNWLFAPRPPGEDFWKRMSDWRTALGECTPGPG